MVGCGIYSTRSGTDVYDIITTSLCVPLGMLKATSPTGITCAFVSLSVVSTGCFRAARLTPIRISSSKVPYPYARILEEAIFLSRLRSQLSISAAGFHTRIKSEFTPPALKKEEAWATGRTSATGSHDRRTPNRKMHTPPCEIGRFIFNFL